MSCCLSPPSHYAKPPAASRYGMILRSSSATLPPHANDLGLTNAPDSGNGFEGMIRTSSVMREVYGLIHRVAATNATVLLTGETGTGKELVARALHRLSPRSKGPFVRVNCGAVSDSLLPIESESSTGQRCLARTTARRTATEKDQSRWPIEMTVESKPLSSPNTEVAMRGIKPSQPRLVAQSIR